MSTNDSAWWTSRAAEMAALDPAFAGEIDRLAEDQVDLLERILHLQPGDRVLDLGCGAGRHAILLHERGYAVTGLDYDAEIIALAKAAWRRRHADQAGPTWVQGDMREPPVQGSFDVVIAMDAAFGCFADDADHLAVLVNAFELLAPGGRLVMEVPNPYYWAHHQHTRHFPPGTLAADAHIVRTYRFDADLGRVDDHLTVFRSGDDACALPVQSLRAWAPTELCALARAAGGSEVAIIGMDGWRVPDQARPLDAATSAFMWLVASR
ncbi:MAG: class I SAM-dependent methyltransferase [Oligoflexia bacterium]|nr:class I SAM-dependent methyltransferase [Oligoflexia bacterium]